MHKVVGVRFRRAGKIYHFNPNGHVLVPGEDVIVETDRGLEYGSIVKGVMKVKEEDIVLPLKKVLRKVTKEDRQRLERNCDQEKKAFNLCLEKIKERSMEMKLVGVEYTFDRSKILFYFTADGRVDFRGLVKDLASIFRTRIELRQIGVRDEAKLIGGMGICGRSFCCTTFLDEFVPVSIRMAKDQNLSLNPSKISGVCGRLMCCLHYEVGAYKCGKWKTCNANCDNDSGGNNNSGNSDSGNNNSSDNNCAADKMVIPERNREAARRGAAKRTPRAKA